jgi:hypothetical protein
MLCAGFQCLPIQAAHSSLSLRLLGGEARTLLRLSFGEILRTQLVLFVICFLVR